MLTLFSAFYYLIKIYLLCDFYQHTHYQGLQTFQKIQGEFRTSSFQDLIATQTLQKSHSVLVFQNPHIINHTAIKED